MKLFPITYWQASTPAFSPLDLTPIVWFKADAITGVSDNDPVLLWNDSSGNGRDATQATGTNQPAYKTGVLNGLPIVRFDDTSDRMTVPSITHNIGAGDFWYALVVKTPGSLVGYNCVLDNGAEFPAIYITNTKVNMYHNGDKLGNTTLSTGTWYTIIAKRVSSVNVYTINGVDDSTTPGSTANITNSGITIGSENGGGVYWGSDIAEIIFGGGTLSAPDQASLQTYLQAKYAHY